MNATVKPFTPSIQQAAVIEWIATGEGSAFVEAVAGSGKTTTLVHGLMRTTGRVAFAAYNKKIADEVEAKIALLMPGQNRIVPGTFHKFGYGAWRKVHPSVKLDANAKRDQVEVALNIPRGLSGFVPKLIGLAKQRALGLFGDINDRSEWYDIVDHHDLAYELDGSVEQGIELAIQGIVMHRDLGPSLVDFDDMIWLPVITGVRMFENDWVFVDEAQDTNPARCALARKMLRRGGRAVFVGDRHQAIYGFTGADADAIDQITKDFAATSLPLTVTFRCPQAVVALAQEVVSHIQAAPTAPMGSVEYLEVLPTDLIASDAILCRNTKPLVETAYSLIRKGIACHVEGKDIGVGLLKLANRWAVKTLDELEAKLEEYRNREVEKLIAKGRETMAEALADRVETLIVLMEGCADLACLRDKIARMFIDSENEAKPTLTLSTVHKSKGREWPRVILLGREELMPSRWARQEWQMQQERNLEYVAITRAQDRLILVPLPVPAPGASRAR